MKDILLKLSNGDNNFSCKIFEQDRTCKILQLDLWGLDEGKGRALVKFEEPIKKTISIPIFANDLPFGYDTEYTTPMKDVEVDSYEEWVNIGY